jgi:hypothetical protein
VIVCSVLGKRFELCSDVVEIEKLSGTVVLLNAIISGVNELYE